jgi:hypothetical protein
MGYESWAEWCDCELDGFMLPTPERREVVEELSQAGISNRAIADVVGVSLDTVNREVKATERNRSVDPDRKKTGKDGKARRQPVKPKQEPTPSPKQIDPVPDLPRPGVTRFSLAIQEISADLANDIDSLSIEEVAEALGAAQFCTNYASGGDYH